MIEIFAFDWGLFTELERRGAATMCIVIGLADKAHIHKFLCYYSLFCSESCPFKAKGIISVNCNVSKYGLTTLRLLKSQFFAKI